MEQSEETSGQSVRKARVASSFAVGYNFFERFAFFGIVAVLSIYLRDQLGYSENVATEIYHAFYSLSFLSPVLAGFLADQYLGKYMTIAIMASIYVVAILIATIGTIPGVPQEELSLLGLCLMTVGAGCYTCVSALGGDQFKLPEHSRPIQTYFLAMYFATNFGATISGFLTPSLRGDIQCLSQTTCYPLAFAVPALFLFVAAVLITSGKRYYILRSPAKSVYTSVVGCIWYATKSKFSSKTANDVDHWLDRSVNKYGAVFVEDVKSLLSVSTLFVPVPIFWALFVQIGSRWTFQASRLNGLTGIYTIKPDQIALANPLFIITLIPLFDRVIYPALMKIGVLTKPLQRMTVGGLMAAAAFMVSGFLELELQKSSVFLPSANHSHLHVMNALDCDITINLPGDTYFISNKTSKLIQELDISEGPHAVVSELHAPCDKSEKTVTQEVYLYSKNVSGLLFWQNGKNKLGSVPLSLPLDPIRTHQGDSRIRFILIGNSGSSVDSNKLTVTDESSEKVLNITYASNTALEGGGEVWESDYVNLFPGRYKISIGEQAVAGELAVGQDGVQTVTISRFSQDPLSMTAFALSSEASICILWLLPQFFILTVGEVLLSVTSFEFSYTQAPETMKSVVQAWFMASVAVGNLIVIIAAGSTAFDNNRAGEFFFFAGLMCLDIVFFAYLAHRYKYIEQKEGNQVQEYEMKLNQGD